MLGIHMRMEYNTIEKWKKMKYKLENSNKNSINIDSSNSDISNEDEV